jgi:CheY-like chemotaxis protein
MMDGGIDPEHIANVAMLKNLPLTDTSTPENLLAVICQPGFTSAKAVSDISGRGVGMDVVLNQILDMGGQLRLKTKPGMGSSFIMQIPVPHLFVRCMLLQAGDRIFAIPTAEVFTTMLMGDLLWQKTNPAQSPLYPITVMEEAGPVPALDLSQYWQGDPNPRATMPTAIAVRSKRPDSLEGIWLVADSMLGQSDLLVNSLPEPMLAPIGMMGVSLQADGRLIPVIDAPVLIEALLSKTQADLVVVNPEAEIARAATMLTDTTGPRARQILVVDDAALMRRRLEGSLTGQGYSVATCSDGLEAWEWLQAHPQPAILITDIEMPGMDGFTLIDRCRQTGMTMPILVVSSRLAEEWSKETQRLGATDYLTKGFTTPELLDKVATLLDLEQLDQSGDRQPSPVN